MKTILLAIIGLLVFFSVSAQEIPVASIDFSFAGYAAGKMLPPQLPAVLSVRPTGGDDTKLLQAAIDLMGKMPVRKNGFRGALHLSEGLYKVSGQLLLNKSGVVIFGGPDPHKTVIRATSTDRRALISIGTVDSVSPLHYIAVTSSTVPADSKTLSLASINEVEVGNYVVVTRPCTANWISDIGMNKDEGIFSENRGMRWPVGSRVLRWDRIVTSVNKAKKQITLDAPITMSLDQLYGGATVGKINTSELVRNLGLEGFTMESEFDALNHSDEEHSWTGVQVNYAEDLWIRDLVCRHFVGSAVRVGPRARRVTVFNCSSEAPVSEIAGYRRLSFLVEGQQVLIDKCVADSGINDFATGFCASGPVVFLDCKATHALGASGGFESWAAGVLFENLSIDGSDLRLRRDFEQTQAAGWTAANSLIWNCRARDIEALGHASAPNRIVDSPKPLYTTLLNNRKSQTALGKNDVWYANRVPDHVHEFTSEKIVAAATTQTKKKLPFSIVNGRFVIAGKLVWGGTAGDNFWRGQPFPAGELNSGICLTRWVPGRTGSGLTEELASLTQKLVAQGNYFYQSLTGLWYDRRRDDHSIFKRKNAMAWAPFFEMPWARSGRGQAWDGLSLYDLSRYNPWYFQRLKEFATLCDEKGLIVYHSLYDTHNLLEYFTHWVDHPFRPVNNINQLSLPEPAVVEPWARFHGANEFYNAADTTLARLHRAYIFHVLDELGSSSNVIFNLGSEFSGPLAFQRFFLQTVNEWEDLNKQRVHLALNTTKDISDSILGEPEFAKMIDVIDTRYWQYRAAGTFAVGDDLWAPPGGLNRSFREMVGENFILQSGIPFSTQQAQMYRQVREYSSRFPAKAIVSVYNDVSPIPSLMAGGAQVIMGSQKDGWQGRTTFQSFVNKHLGSLLMNMKPADDIAENKEQNWCLSDQQRQSLLIYSISGETIKFSTALPATDYAATWYDPLSEKELPVENIKSLKKGEVIKKPSRLNWLLLLTAKTAPKN